MRAESYTYLWVSRQMFRKQLEFIKVRNVAVTGSPWGSMPSLAMGSWLSL